MLAEKIGMLVQKMLESIMFELYWKCVCFGFDFKVFPRGLMSLVLFSSEERICYDKTLNLMLLPKRHFFKQSEKIFIWKQITLLFQ